MPPKTKKKPSPEQLLAEVKGLKPAKTYAFDDYVEVIDELHRKDYSYADIAKTLSEKLGIPVARGQAYRAHMLWKADVRRIEEQEAEEQRQHEEMIAQEAHDQESYEGAVQDASYEAARDVLKYIGEKYPPDKCLAKQLDILKAALAMVAPEIGDELSAAEEDGQLEDRKAKAQQ